MHWNVTVCANICIASRFRSLHLRSAGIWGRGLALEGRQGCITDRASLFEHLDLIVLGTVQDTFRCAFK